VVVGSFKLSISFLKLLRREITTTFLVLGTFLTLTFQLFGFICIHSIGGKMLEVVLDTVAAGIPSIYNWDKRKNSLPL
jgi:hypothetical protein